MKIYVFVALYWTLVLSVKCKLENILSDWKETESLIKNLWVWVPEND